MPLDDLASPTGDGEVCQHGCMNTHKWLVIGQAIKSTGETLRLALVLVVITVPPVILGAIFARKWG